MAPAPSGTEWLFNILMIAALGLSFGASLYLASAVLASKQRRAKLAAQQLGALAASDLAWCALRLLDRIAWLLGRTALPRWLSCGCYVCFFRWLQLNSVLFSALIPVAVLAALWRRPQMLRYLAWAPLFVPPLASALTAGYLWRPAAPERDSVYTFCRIDTVADDVFLVEVLVVGCFMALVFASSLCRLRFEVPASVAERSVRFAGRYMLAYVVSFLFFAGSLLYFKVFSDDRESTVYWIVRGLRGVTLSLNGFLNFLAFTAQRRATLRRQRALPPVAFQTQVQSIVSFQEDEGDQLTWSTLGFEEDEYPDGADPEPYGETGSSFQPMTRSVG